MPSPPSTRPSDAPGRRSFAFAREDSGRASGSALLVDHRWRRAARLRAAHTGARRKTIASAADIRVNERLETSAPEVWALGECAGSPQFTHISEDDFRIIRDNLAGKNRGTRDRLVAFACSRILHSPTWD